MPKVISLPARLLVFVFFLVGIYFLPWWIVFACVFVVMLIKRVVLVELLVPAFIMDVIYGAPIDRFYDFQFMASLIMVVILIVAFLVKKYVRA